MRRLVLVLLGLLLAGSVYADDAESDSLIRLSISDFMSALQTGEGLIASGFFSEQAIAQVEVMLVSVKQSLDQDPEATLRRLNGVGYAIELEEAEDWETEDYLAATLSLPLITARYAPYDLAVSLVTVNNRSAQVEMIFSTSTGLEIPQQATMDFEDGDWKVTSFMGITAFP